MLIESKIEFSFYTIMIKRRWSYEPVANRLFESSRLRLANDDRVHQIDAVGLTLSKAAREPPVLSVIINNKGLLLRTGSSRQKVRPLCYGFCIEEQRRGSAPRISTEKQFTLSSS